MEAVAQMSAAGVISSTALRYLSIMKPEARGGVITATLPHFEQNLGFTVNLLALKQVF